MLLFLKYLLQLVLSPGRGWNDLRKTAPDPDELLRRGVYPLIAISAATELLALFYHHGIGVATVIVRVIADFGSYFIAIFVAKLLFELYLERLTTRVPDAQHVGVLTTCGIGLMVLIQIVSNCVPWNLVLIKFMPLYVVMVLYKAIPYMSVGKGHELQFIGLTSAALVVVPLAIYYLLYILI